MTIKVDKIRTGARNRIVGYYVTTTVGVGKSKKTVAKIVKNRAALTRYLVTRAIQPLPYSTRF